MPRVPADCRDKVQRERSEARESYHRLKRVVIIVGLLVSSVLANDSKPAPSSGYPSEQQVLTFIADTVDWYRHLPAEQQVGTAPTDLVFLENNRTTATEIVRLAFDFGKAAAAIRSMPQDVSAEPAAADPATTTPALQSVAAAKAKVQTAIQKANSELKTLTEARYFARRKDRDKLDTQIADVRSRIQVLKGMSENYDSLVGFIHARGASPDRPTNMADLVDNLERTVPELSGTAGSSQSVSVPATSSPRPSGIMGSIFDVSELARKRQIIDNAIRKTAELSESLQDIRTPLLAELKRKFAAITISASADGLRRQKARLDDLVAESGTVSPAIAALNKQCVLLDLYKDRLTEWRSQVQANYQAAWKNLVGHLGALAGAIAILVVVASAVRRLTVRHVRDSDARKMLLTGQRILLFLTMILIVSFAFTFDVGSLATFLGLVSAGLAVGLHDVFVAIGGYFLITRKFRVQVGDRVQIAGVTGDVFRLGLMQFELTEINTATEQPTGRLVFFSNSYVFLSPATPLYRQVRARA
ncbi:MAG TPA: hypothetical protein VE621_04075 [Bryobacteraceae bacterium]|nr:hypothetical protein [Bryobacteraceae bacterium]